MATELLQITVTETGSRSVARSIEAIGTSAGSATRLVSGLVGVLNSLGVAFGATQFLTFLDSFQNLQNRLVNVTTGTANLNRVYSELLSISQQTRTSLESTAIIYQRFAMNTSRLGMSQQELLDIVKSVNQVVAASGATSIEARNALIQFSQGLASGTLRGDELRSVLEQLPQLGRYIAQGMGIAFEDLRKVAKEGGLTPEKILRAIQKMAPDIQQAFARMTPTIGQAFTVLRNSALDFIGRSGQTSGASQLIANSVISLATNIGVVANAFMTFGLVYAAVLGARFLAVLARASAALLAFAYSNPFTAILATIGLVISALYNFGGSIEAIKGTGITVQDYVVGAFRVLATYAGQAWEVIQTGASQAWAALQGAWGQGPGWFQFLWDSVLTYGRAAFNGLVGLAVGAWNSITGLWGVWGDFIRAVALAGLDIFQRFWTFISDLGRTAYAYVIENWTPFSGTMGGFINQVGETFRAVVNGIVGAWAGLYNTLVAGFSLLPAALGDIAIRAANALIQPLARGINTLIQGLNRFNLNIAPLSETGLTNNFSGAAQSFGEVAAREFGESMSRDYVGEFSSAARRAATESESGRIIAQSFAESLGRDYVGEMGRAITPAATAAARAVDEEARRRAEARRLSQEVGGLNPAGARGRAAQEANEAAGKKKKDEFLEALKKQLKDIKGPMNDFLLNQRALDQLLKEGKITAEEYAKQWEKIRLKFLETQTTAAAGLERALIKLSQEAANRGKMIEDALTNAFNAGENAFVEFAKTGKFSFKGLVDSIIADVAKMIYRLAIQAPIVAMLKSIFGGGGFDLGSMFGSFLGGGGGGSTGTAISFATGGQHIVGGSGGVDSQMFNVRASPGERISVLRSGQSDGGSGSRGGVSVKVYNAPAGTQAEAKTSEDGMGNLNIDIILTAIKGELVRDIQERGGVSRAIQGRFGLSPKT